MKYVRKRAVKFALIILITTIVFLLNLVTAQQSRAAGNSISSSLGVIPYPTKGQTPSQQNADEGECFAWAKQQTGIDPMAVASRPTKQSGPAVGGGERVGGAAVGAAGGLPSGRSPVTLGKGRCYWCGSRTYLGRRYAGEKEQGCPRGAGRAGKGEDPSELNRAFGACMEGVGMWSNERIKEACDEILAYLSLSVCCFVFPCLG